MNVPESKLQPLVDWCNAPAPPRHFNLVAAFLTARNNQDAGGAYTGYLYLMKPKLAPMHFAGALTSAGGALPAMSVTVGLSNPVNVEIAGQLSLSNGVFFPAFADMSDFDEVIEEPTFVQLHFATPDYQAAPYTGFEGILQLYATTVLAKFNPNKQLVR